MYKKRGTTAYDGFPFSGRASCRLVFARGALFDAISHLELGSGNHKARKISVSEDSLVEYIRNMPLISYDLNEPWG